MDIEIVENVNQFCVVVNVDNNNFHEWFKGSELEWKQ